MWANVPVMRHPRGAANNAESHFAKHARAARGDPRPPSVLHVASERRAVPRRANRSFGGFSLTLILGGDLVRHRPTGASGCTLRVENNPRLIWCPWTELARRARGPGRNLSEGANSPPRAPALPFFRAADFCVRARVSGSQTRFNYRAFGLWKKDRAPEVLVWRPDEFN